MYPVPGFKRGLIARSAATDEIGAWPQNRHLNAAGAAAAAGTTAGAAALTLSLIAARLKDYRGMVIVEPLTW